MMEANNGSARNEYSLLKWTLEDSSGNSFFLVLRYQV